MEQPGGLTKECVDSLLKAGMEKAEASLDLTRKTELNLEGGKFSLMRTTEDVALSSRE